MRLPSRYFAKGPIGAEAGDLQSAFQLVQEALIFRC